ncbi:MAG: DnaD domain protein [Firmicutes bacterium]|uniref:DnaD domain protein n=1 Tax=Candidatus Onthovivens merdipullorum TaxID=2840889 RepID=A0A9D9DGW7_9BACL|nr:DnaD domain protein [Candidatus Onthovivens merdipullorum]
MENIKANYEIKTRTILLNEYIEFLYTLYLPLIGQKAVFLYEFFNNYYRYGYRNDTLEHLVTLSSLSLQDFLFERNKLEAINLISTYKNNDDNFIIIINPILSPKNFFNNDVLKGLFIENIGKEKALEIMDHYEIDDDTSGYKDISKGITDMFSVNFNIDNLDLGKDKKLISTNKIKMKDNFSDLTLLNFISENSNINIKAITENEINKIHNIGVLFGLNEKIMGEITIDSFKYLNKIGEKIDLENVSKRAKNEVISSKSYNRRINKKNKVIINSNSPVSEKIKYYQEVSPRDLLKNRQNGAEPVSSDLNIIEYLSNNMDFDYSIINAILDYTLDHTNESLSKNYVEKIAAFLKRKNVRNCLEALEALYPDNYKVKDENKSSNTVDLTKDEIEGSEDLPF